MEARRELITRAFSTLPTEMAFKILDNLDDQSLFSYRRASRGWCQVASTILQNRPTVTVSPWCPPDPKRKDSLANLIQCFNKSREFHYPFPFTNFELIKFKGSIPECPDVRRFFALSLQSNSGLVIKGLYFEYINPSPATISTLERLIFQGAPHLRTLSLKLGDGKRNRGRGRGEATNKKRKGDKSRPCIDGDGDSTVKVDIEKTLPSLQVLQLSTCSGAVAMEFVTKILRAAPNLQKIEDPGHDNKGYPYLIHYPCHLQPLLDAKKLHLVRRCRFMIDKDLMKSGLVTREKLSGFQPNVLEIIGDGRYVNDQKIKAGSRELLWTVKDVVEKLETDFCFGMLDILDVPQFSKLRFWDLSCGEYPIFPPGRRNFDFFPKLEKIRLYFDDKEDENTIFPAWSTPTAIPVIPTVHSLEIWSRDIFSKHEEAKGCLESIGVMCPNVRNLELFYDPPDVVDFARLAPLVWTNMRKVQTLWLGNRSEWTGKISSEMMEAGFTGLSLETVRRLKGSMAIRWLKMEWLEHLRVNPSILQLTELKKLAIKKDLLEADERKEDSKLSLPLSYKYAFNLMPQLVVEIFQCAHNVECRCT